MSIKVYGADWCGDTQRTLKQLGDLGVKYDYIDIDEDAAGSRWVKEQNDGSERKPTLDINGQILSVPSDAELEQALRAQNLVK